MKKFTFCLLTFIIILNISYSATYDKIIFDKDNVDLYESAIFSSDITAIVGESGLLKFTNTGGSAWEYYLTKEKKCLYSVEFTTNGTLFFCGKDGNIYKKSNQGSTDPILLKSGVKEILRQIKFKTDDLGIAVGDNGTIVKTTDNGLTWKIITTGTSSNLKGVAFLNNNEVLTVGDGATLLKSTNAGDTWTKIFTGYNINFTHIRIPESKRIYIGGDSLTVIFSDDGGNIWNKFNIEPNYSSLYVRPYIAGFVVVNDNKLNIRIHDMYASLPRWYEYFTSDGGEIWNSNELNSGWFGPKQGYDIVSISCFNGSFGYAVGSYGELYAITPQNDMSFNYEELSNTFIYDFISVDNPDPKNIAVISGNGNGAQYLWLSNDAENFRKIKLNYPGFDGGSSTIRNVVYPDKDLILITFDNWYDTTIGSTTYMSPEWFVARSTDGGNNFEIKRNSKIKGFSSIDMYDKNYGVLSEYSDTLNYTTNGGLTWETAMLPDSNSYCYHADTPEPGFFYCFSYVYTGGTYNRTFIKSNDYGKTWIVNQKLIEQWFTKMKFMDKYTGFASSRVNDSLNSDYFHTVLYKTSDAGETWQICYYEEKPSYMGGVDFDILDENYILGVNSHNEVILTKDGGKTWVSDSNGMLNDGNLLKALSCLDEKNAIIVGQGNKIIIRSETETGISEFSQSTESDEIGIFPNPVVDVLRIALNNHFDGKLLVNDLNGNLIIDLTKNLNDFKASGEFAVNTSDLSSGMYSIVLESNGIRYSKKFIIKK